MFSLLDVQAFAHRHAVVLPQWKKQSDTKSTFWKDWLLATHTTIFTPWSCGAEGFSIATFTVWCKLLYYFFCLIGKPMGRDAGQKLKQRTITERALLQRDLAVVAEAFK